MACIPFGLEVNWQKTKVEGFGSREDEPLTIIVQGQNVVVIEKSILAPLSTQQLNAVLTSQVAMLSLVQLCRI